ncbi:MAG TPA: hypothetical protein VHA80_07460 [Solirubrobacterales bacterium]|nr:hypothetical protein [Solirubrobacterales bacterium]
MHASRSARGLTCALLLAAAFAALCALASAATSHRPGTLSERRQAKARAPRLQERIPATGTRDDRRRQHKHRNRRRHHRRHKAGVHTGASESAARKLDDAIVARTPAGTRGEAADGVVEQDSGKAPAPPAPDAPTSPPPAVEPEAPAAPPIEPVRSSDCFTSPHVCEFPDPTNTGVPAGVLLTPSGSISVSQPGKVISDMDVTGTIEINASNVTVEDTRVTQTSSCGTTSTCGNFAIKIAAGVTGVKIAHVETATTQGATCEHDIRNTGGEVTIEATYMHGCDGNVYAVGPTVLKDSYGVAKIEISSDHIENVYFNETRFTAIHDTLLNPVGQTAVIFGNSGGGTDVTNCSNQLTIQESLLAGGGYSIYPCAHSSRPGSSTLNVEGNHFARCRSAETYEPDGGHHPCSGGPDSSGYYPKSGSYGIATDYYQGTGVWRGNVWDDDLSRVCITGASSGCE